MMNVRGGGSVTEDDEETAKGVCQVLIRLGENFTHQLFAHDAIGQPFVEFALACASHKSREVTLASEATPCVVASG
jgi:hypothetical protein